MVRKYPDGATASTTGNLAADFSIVIDNNAALTVGDFNFGIAVL